MTHNLRTSNITILINCSRDLYIANYRIYALEYLITVINCLCQINQFLFLLKQNNAGP